MSIYSDNNDLGPAPINSVLIPVSTDKSTLSWDGNDATILGLLYETGRYYKNKGLFQTLLRDRAVALANGKLAIEDYNTVHFTSGAASDPRSFDDPCPPTVDRRQDYNDDIDLGSRKGTKLADLTNIPAEHKDTIILAKHCVEKEDANFLHSLTYVFGNVEPSEQLLEDADGSGLKFLQLLRDRGKAASPRDKALVATKFAGIVRDGVHGELTLDSFSSFLKSYKAARRNIAPSSRPSDEAEVEMISVIAVKDSASRELYELKTSASPPISLDQASTILLGMLRGRVRCEEIDQLSSGAKVAALASDAGAKAEAAGAGAGAASPAIAALAAAGLNPSSLSPEQLAALVSALAPPDPRLNGAGKVVVPRGPDGAPSRWVEGMAKCRCGIKGGKHLFKDCPKKKEKAEKAAKAQAEKEKALASELSSSGLSALTQDQLRSALAALITGTETAIPSNGSE